MIRLMFMERQIQDYAEYLYQRKKRYSYTCKHTVNNYIFPSSSLACDVFPFGYTLGVEDSSVKNLVSMIKHHLLERDSHLYAQMVQFVSKGYEYLDGISLEPYHQSYDVSEDGKTLNVYNTIDDSDICSTVQLEEMTDLFQCIFKDNNSKLKKQFIDEVSRSMITQFLFTQEEKHMSTQQPEVLTGVKESPLMDILNSISYNIKGTKLGDKIVNGFISHLVLSSKIESEEFISGVEIKYFKDFLGNRYIIPDDLKEFSIDILVRHFFPTEDVVILAFNAYYAEVTAYLNYALEFGTISTDLTSTSPGVVTHHIKVEFTTPFNDKCKHSAHPITDLIDGSYATEEVLKDALIDSIMMDITTGNIQISGYVQHTINHLTTKYSNDEHHHIHDIAGLVKYIKPSLSEMNGSLALSIIVPGLTFEEDTELLRKEFQISHNLTQTTSNIKKVVELSNVIGLSSILSEMYDSITTDTTEPEKQVPKNKVTAIDVEALMTLMESMEYDIHTAYDKVVIVTARLPKNGFTFVGSSACVDPANFDLDMGINIAKKDIEKQLWLVEGYLLQNELFGKEK